MSRILAATLSAIVSLALLGPLHAQTDEELRQMYFRRDFAPIEQLARGGDVRAEAWMALIRQRAGDRMEAKLWWRKAAAKDNRWAISMLAEMLRRDGENEEALHWYRRGAELGYPEQQSTLAWIYRDGRVVARNDAEAVRWYRAAAAQRHFGAYLPLAEMIAAGEGTTRDPVEAYAFAEVARHFQHDHSDTLSIERAKQLKTKLAQDMGPDAIAQAERRVHEIRPDLAGIIARRKRVDFIMNAIAIVIAIGVIGFLLAVVFGAMFALYSFVQPLFSLLWRRQAVGPPDAT